MNSIFLIKKNNNLKQLKWKKKSMKIEINELMNSIFFMKKNNNLKQ